MAKRKPHFGQTDATKLQDALHGLTDAGLVFLKAFASVEHLMNCLLATRLGSKPEMLPMLSFIAARLALIGLTEEAFETLLRRAAHIRNQIAHEIDTPKPGEFASFIGEVREWSQKNRHDCAYELSLPQLENKNSLMALKEAYDKWSVTYAILFNLPRIWIPEALRNYGLSRRCRPTIGARRFGPFET